MRAMLFEGAGRPLRLAEIPDPEPGPGQIRIRVRACGVCRTDLHVFDGELSEPKLPLILGHEIVGSVDALGPGVGGFEVGERVGVPWLGHTCGICPPLSQTRGESLRRRACSPATRSTAAMPSAPWLTRASASGYLIPMPTPKPRRCSAPGSSATAPTGWQGTPGRLGLYGFGAAAHLLVSLAVHEGREVYAFTRPGDTAGQDFARSLGACWAGGSDESPPHPLDAAIVFAPVGALVPAALRATGKGGTVVCAGIHMSEIPAFPYELLWGERVLRSVANLTRRDGVDFLGVAGEVRIPVAVQTYPLEEAGRALADLREGRLHGAGVLLVG